MDELDKIRAELLATQVINGQIAAMMLRLVEGIRRGEAHALVDLIDQILPTEMAHAAKRKNLPDDVARLADDEASRQLAALRQHIDRATAGEDAP